ncbi:MAG TPA: hypothetical protein PLF26_05340 [Blastocatellia bacterium]|nr:hypothetical protein [Blastocatellia bacterium]
MKTSLRIALCALSILSLLIAPATAEVKRKRYTFDLNPKIRQASINKAKNQAKSAFLRDYLAGKFSPEIVDRYAEDIDIALTPPDRFLTRFEIIAEDEDSKPGQVVLTVEGEVDLAAMVSALVQGDVLSFGDDPPKIMMMPSPRFTSDVPVEPLRALVYNDIKQAGLRPVDYTMTKENVSIQVRKGGQLEPNAVKVLARQAEVYNADFLIYVDIDPQVKPFSQGGYIADSDLTYTIVRPNANEILGEGAISARGSGSAPKLAYNKALDEIAPIFSADMMGNLYASIYSNSDVITDTVQLKNQIELTVDEAKPEQIQALLSKLKGMGARVDLAAGSGSGLVSHFNIEIAMDDEQLYEMLNSQRVTAAGKEFKTPVVFYAENRVEVEVVPVAGTPKKALAAKPKNRNTALAGNRGFNGGSGSGAGRNGTALSQKAKITLQLRPAKFSPN